MRGNAKVCNLLQDNNITLRFVEDSDAALLMELNNDPEIARCVVGTPRTVTLSQQLQWMENIKSETKTKRFIVEYDGESVGTVIISDIDLCNKVANVNIKIKSGLHGKGIGKRSIKLALAYCFDKLELFCVTAHVLSYNKASIALFEHCGFTNEGVLRSRVIKDKQRFDLFSFSMLRDEFQK